MAKNHEISVYFSTNEILAFRHNSEIQNELVSKRRPVLNWKAVNSYINLLLLKPDEDKTFSGSLILDLRI